MAMKIHQLSVDDVYQTLRSAPEGLTEAEARRRLSEFGPNRIDPPQRTSLVTRLVREFTHFFAVILWIAAALSVIAEWQQPGQGMGTLAIAIVAVILVNGVFSFWQEFRAERALGALERLLPQQVRVLREGTTTTMDASRLVPGDVALLEAGDRVPADCRMVEAFALLVNNATVTGESRPTARDAVPSNEADPLAARNVLLAGTAVVAGRGTAVVFATGGRTEFGLIARLTQSVGDAPSPLRREIERVSRLVAILATGLGILFFFVAQALELSFWGNLIFAIGIIVANVPEGLLPTLTLSLAMASQRMARRRALVRHLAAVETMGAVTVICTDKTGTLTQNRMTAARLHLGGRAVPLGAGAGEDLGSLAHAHARFFECARVCNSLREARVGPRHEWVGDPTEIALVELAERAGVAARPVGERMDEVPFDSDRRRFSVLYRHGDDHVLYTKGALETVLPRCGAVVLEGAPESLTDATRERLRAAERSLAGEGLRVLALAERRGRFDPAHDRLEEDLTLVGLVGLHDPPRPEVPAAISRCHEAGIRVIMITGDYPGTADAIAAQIGLRAAGGGGSTITGEQLARMSDVQLQLALGRPGVLFARVRADQKMRIVSALRRKGEIVAATGDGVNDAPALREADIGIAMGVVGTDVAREAADLILLDDNFATIVHAVEEGRTVFVNIRKFLTYILSSNIPEMVPYLAYVLLGIPLPLTIIQILAVDLGTDMVPALALGSEPPHRHVMRMPPRPREERLLSGAVLARAYGFLGVMEAATGMGAYFWVLRSGGWTFGTPLPSDDPLYLAATSACLAAIVITQVVNLLVCRSAWESALVFSGTVNPLILAGLSVELIIAGIIIYTPAGNRFFGTAPLGPDAYIPALAGAGMMLILEEARKAWVRRGVRPARLLAPAA